MKRPPWNARRRIVHGTLLFCAGIVVWLIWKGEDTNLASAVANACFFLAGSVIGAYVFGAAYDDKNVMQHLGAEAYQDYEPTLTAHPATGSNGEREPTAPGRWLEP